MKCSFPVVQLGLEGYESLTTMSGEDIDEACAVVPLLGDLHLAERCTSFREFANKAFNKLRFGRKIVTGSRAAGGLSHGALLYGCFLAV